MAVFTSSQEHNVICSILFITAVSPYMVTSTPTSGKHAKMPSRHHRIPHLGEDGDDLCPCLGRGLLQDLGGYQESHSVEGPHHRHHVGG